MLSRRRITYTLRSDHETPSYLHTQIITGYPPDYPNWEIL